MNIAFTLAAIHDKRVLVVDVDPQFNATQYLVGDQKYIAHINDPAKGTIRDIFVPRAPAPVRTATGNSKGQSRSRMELSACTISIYDGSKPSFARSGRGRLDIIPSTLDLVEVQNSPRQTENKLNSYLQEKAVNYDYVIIDCPPTISIFTEAAILASDKYVVPIRPDVLSVLGLPLLERYIADYTMDAGKKLEQVGLIFTMVRKPTPTAMKNVMLELRRVRAGATFETAASISTHVAESVEGNRPVIYYNRATSNIRSQYLDVTKEFLRRTGG